MDEAGAVRASGGRGPRSWSWTLLLAACLCSVAVSDAGAQSRIASTLSALLINESEPTPDRAKDLQAAAATRDTLAQLVLVELSTLPISSSASGFIYRLNSSLGTLERASSSFGPFFTERALRPGQGQTSLGLTFRTASFNRLQGASLTDGSFPVNASRPSGASAPDQTDTMALDISARTVTAFGTVGVTDRLDVGAALPFVSLGVEGTRVNNFRGLSTVQAAGSARATGVGDLAVRARYQLATEEAYGLAAGIDMRLPTGDSDNLLGAGKTSARFFGIGSFDGPRAGVHLNAGYTVGGASREVGYNAATTYAVSPQVTLVGEFLGRWIADLHRLNDVYRPHETAAGLETMRWLPGEEGVHQALAAAGVKWNIANTYLLNASLLFRLTESGLTARVIPSITLDYTFDR